MYSATFTVKQYPELLQSAETAIAFGNGRAAAFKTLRENPRYDYAQPEVISLALDAIGKFPHDVARRAVWFSVVSEAYEV